MSKIFDDVLKDIEINLMGMQLKSISGNAAPFSINKVDYVKSNVVLVVQGQEKQKTWKFERLEEVWREMYNYPVADVEVVLKGSGSSRNQVETIFASLAYVEWLHVDGKKCIAFVREDTHEYGTLKKMEDDRAAQCRDLAHKPYSWSPFLLPPNANNPDILSRNHIYFGAPGTGKSYKMNEAKDMLLGSGNEPNYERVTFHPDYSYANFVGTYKPIPCKNSHDEDAITYEYVPGPFMRVYVKAIKSQMTGFPEPFLLLIEEINRANVAAVFGDVFQLLDRGDDNTSEYPIEASEDIKKYLVKELGGEPDDYAQIRIPDNMFIWATMNSADQGVFPMDTAFKRRWDFTYLGIDDSDEKIRGKYVLLADDKSQKVEWNKLRKAINNFLAKEKINEDKQLGPYFISRNIVAPEDGDEIDRERFIHTFKDKVIMYLFEDAAKQKRARLFEGCFQNSTRYSEICREFDEKGIGIFNHEIQLEAEPETVSGAAVEADE